MIDRTAFLEPSPHQADAGALIGRIPLSIGRETLLTLDGPTTPMRAIRAKCLDCCAGGLSEVRKCTAIACPLWAFRMGRSPYRPRGGTPDVDEPEADEFDPFS